MQLDNNGESLEENGVVNHLKSCIGKELWSSGININNSTCKPFLPININFAHYSQLQ